MSNSTYFPEEFFCVFCDCFCYHINQNKVICQNKEFFPISGRKQISCYRRSLFNGKCNNFYFKTERRCVSFNVVANDPAPLYNIHDMLDAVDPNGPRAANYGCSGSGNMDHTAANKGSPIDGMDKALLARKNCLRCAVDNHSTEYEKYSFDPQSNTCQDASGTALRRFCECDKELASVNKLLYNSSFENYGGCVKNGAGSGNSICCLYMDYFSKLNGDRYQCCTGGGHAEIGAC